SFWRIRVASIGPNLPEEEQGGTGTRGPLGASPGSLAYPFRRRGLRLLRCPSGAGISGTVYSATAGSRAGGAALRLAAFFEGRRAGRFDIAPPVSGRRLQEL